MLLAIDIGNTETTFGVFEGEKEGNLPDDDRDSPYG